MRLSIRRNLRRCEFNLAALRELIFVVLLILGMSSSSIVNAQTGGWDQPVNISATAGYSTYPSIVVDGAGNVHVVWCEADDPEEPTFCNAIYYAFFDGQAWSQPVDIVIAGITERVNTPVLAIDAAGVLHMTWVGAFGDRVMYSQAYAPLASSGRHWLLPMSVSPSASTTSDPDIAVSPDGTVHIVFAVQYGQNSGIFHTSSFDGETWTSPVPIYGNDSAAMIVAQPRLAVDSGNGLHVSWAEANYPETYPPIGLRYARSLDGGKSWEEMHSITGPYNWVGIHAPNASEIHLVWSGTSTDRHKFHSWSSDRGVSWSRPVETLEVGGQQGWAALASDAVGRVHLFQVAGSLDESLKYQVWSSGSWSLPVTLLTRLPEAPNHPYNADLAVGLGNQLHGLTTQFLETPAGSGYWQYDVFYLHAVMSDVPAVEPQVLSTPARAPDFPTSTALLDVGPTATPHSTGLSEQPAHETQVKLQDSHVPVLLGVASALVIGVLGVVASMFHRSRR